MLSLTSPLPTVDNTWGAAFIGLILASALYGLTTLQVYIYFVNYPNDGKGLKALALIVWVIDTASLALVCVGMYGYLITDMNNPLARLKVNRSLDIDPALMGFLAFLTHGYLGMRVWRVCNRSVVIGGIIALLSFTALGLAIAASVACFQFEYWFEREAIKTLALAGTSLVVFLDTFIATILCVYLLKQKTKGREMRRLVRRIVFFAINTGLASSVLSIVNIVTFLALPNTMIFLGTNFIFTKVYANCLLANLNARKSLRGKGYLEDGTLSLNLSALRGADSAGAIVYNDPSTSDLSEPPMVNLRALEGSSKDRLFARTYEDGSV